MDRPETWLAGTGLPPQSTRWKRASRRPTLTPSSPSATSPPDALERACSPRLRELQRAARAPSVVAAVVRDGAVAWSGAAGLADVEREPGLDTQYRIGSITKTFT